MHTSSGVDNVDEFAETIVEGRTARFPTGMEPDFGGQYEDHYAVDPASGNPTAR